MPANQSPSVALLQWLQAQLNAGHDAPAVLEAMQASGWSLMAAQEALARVLGQPLQEVANSMAHKPAAHTLQAAGPDIQLGPHCIELQGRQVRVLMAMDRPRVVVIEGLLSDPECEALIDGARGRLARSETFRDLDGAGEVHVARTSSGMFYGRGETPLIQALEARLAQLLAWPVECGEGLQVLCYATGAQYQAHHDFFDPLQPGSKAVLKRGGQRVGTVVMYLNTPTEGGATTFPEVGLQVQAVRGNAVFFAYPDASAASLTLHGGAPVLVGEKWVATKWLRQTEFR